MRTKTWAAAGLGVVLAAGVAVVAQEPRADRRDDAPRFPPPLVEATRSIRWPASEVADEAAVPRYQISSWSDATGEKHGAYVIDSQTGEVFLIRGSREPEAIGRLPRVGRDAASRHYGDPLRTPQVPPVNDRRR